MTNTKYTILFNKYLTHSATKEELILLIEWMRQNDDSDEWLDAEWRLSEEYANPQEAIVFEKIKSRLNLDQEIPIIRQPIFKLKYLIGVAAFLALIFMVGWKLFIVEPSGLIQEDQIVNVGKGQNVNLVLSDGSKVWINSDSKLQYGSRFNSKERVLKLSGEAFFDVSSDKKRPFIVETNNLSVKALGTNFNVKCYENEDKITVVLLSGDVEVFNESEKILLKPNQKLVYDKTTNSIQKYQLEYRAEPEKWTKENTRLNFESETFENIARALERKHNVVIVFNSEQLKGLRFTGTLPNDLNSALKLISFSIPLRYEMSKDLVVVRAK